MRRTSISTIMVLLLLLMSIIPTPFLATVDAQSGPYVTSSGAVYVRGGPGMGFWILGTLYSGEIVPVLGISPDGLWWYVNATFGEGWVSVGSVAATGTSGVSTIDPGVIATVTSISALHVRYGDGVNSQSLGVLGHGDQVFVIGRNTDGSWLQIRWEYGTGWVSAAYLNGGSGVSSVTTDTSADPYVIVTSTYLNIRTGPGPNYAVLGQASNGDVLLIVGRTSDNTWYQVDTVYGTGWVYSSYVTTRNEYGSSPVTTSSAADATVTGPFGIINTGALNIRSGPGAQYTSIGAVAGGTETVIIGRNADWSWWLLDTPVGSGWASALYVIARGDTSAVPYVAPGGTVTSVNTDTETAPSAVVSGPEAIITTGALHIRSGPNSSFTSIGAVYGGTRMPIIGQSTDRGWWQVDSTFGVGWVSKLYVLTNGDTSAVPVVQ